MKRRGFTLIELLVVVGVIALLLSIMVPSLAKARKLAKTTVCQTNQRALTMALRVYVQDWKVGTLYGGHAAPYGAWDYQLLGGSMTKADFYKANGRGNTTYHIRCCPETAYQAVNGLAVGTATLQWNCGTGGYANGSYGLNSWLQARTDGSTPRGLYRLNRTTIKEWTVPTFVDSVAHDLNCLENDPIGNLLAPGGASNFGSLTSAGINRHNMAVNVSFLDGHSETVPLKNLWTLAWSSTWSRTTPQTIK